MATVAIPVPTKLIQPVLDKLDALKAKFLAVPANTRAALDKLARVRTQINRTPNVPSSINASALQVENNLKRVQQEWQVSADSFSMLDNLRRTGSVFTMDSLQLASSLGLSAAFVLKNADASVAAVDQLAAKYLTPEQQRDLDVSTVGVAGGPGLLTYGVLALGALYLLRRR